MSSSATSQRLVLMGAILGAHGIKGEVKVKSFAAKPAAIAEYGPLTDTKHKRSFDLAIVGTEQQVTSPEVPVADTDEELVASIAGLRADLDRGSI